MIRFAFLTLIMLFSACGQEALQVSGIYPHLAYYNEGRECGTGAVVPWADRLWLVTYGPHFPYGSADKLYEISPDLVSIVRQESIGGTPANRMIHRESKQLFIGPYAISAEGQVRAIPYDQMPGRHTGNARHLTDPGEKIYYASMEEGFYEVDVKSLKVKVLYSDGHELPEEDYSNLLPGAHGKGLYSGQGVLVYSNNGELSHEALEKSDIESGALMEWNGKDWKLIRRNQFVEVTGPGGIHGNKDPENDPVWTTGWDHKSLLLGVRDAGKGSWEFYRLPKSSHTYDGAHGWYTEWPRIRDVGSNKGHDYIMTMHGMFWRFPENFSMDNSGGIRPRSAYLKVIGDFSRWRRQLVFGCDDSGQGQTLNTRKVKGNISGPGQSNSNLWFTDLEMPDLLGPTTAEGGVWLREEMDAGKPSEPFLLAGWSLRCCWIQNESDSTVSFLFETDRRGKGQWQEMMRVNVPGKGSKIVEFSENETSEWVRVIPHRSAHGTVHFSYTGVESRADGWENIFRGLASAKDHHSIGGLLYSLGDNRRTLGVAVQQYSGKDKTLIGYYELNERLELSPVEDSGMLQYIQDEFAIPEDVLDVEESSILIIDDQDRRWRLPRGDEAFTELTRNADIRLCREVVTQRDLFNCHGTFYELPAESADGFAKLRPVASHPFRIHDFASYRGLLVMTGIQPDMAGNGSHMIRSKDGKAAVWVGVIDDLWELGKPTGHGGPWLGTETEAGEASDPYLIGFYDDRSLTLSHNSDEPITFDIEADPMGDGPWMLYQRVTIAPGATYRHRFPDHFQARWIRFISDRPTRATAWLDYQ